jgi:hypothetical protein
MSHDPPRPTYRVIEGWASAYSKTDILSESVLELFVWIGCIGGQRGKGRSCVHALDLSDCIGDTNVTHACHQIRIREMRADVRRERKQAASAIGQITMGR